MKDVIVVNGVKIPVYQQIWVKGIVGVFDSQNNLNILCPQGTMDEEVIEYLKKEHADVIFSPIKEKKTTHSAEKSSADDKEPETQEATKNKSTIGARPTDAMRNPWNVFSPIIPTVKEKDETPRSDKSQIESVVKSQRGFRIKYRYSCAYCGMSHFNGYEYTLANGRIIIICDFCRSEILQHKGWIHEISANIGGKK